MNLSGFQRFFLPLLRCCYLTEVFNAMVTVPDRRRRKGADRVGRRRKRRSGVESVRWFDFEIGRKVNRMDGGDGVVCA